MSPASATRKPFSTKYPTFVQNTTLDSAAAHRYVLYALYALAGRVQLGFIVAHATRRVRRRDPRRSPPLLQSASHGVSRPTTTPPDLPPEPGVHTAFARDHEHKRHCTVTLLAGINLLSDKVHALVKDRHCTREFLEFLKLLDAAYPAHTAIHLIFDNHSAHISRETRAWLAEQPAGRFVLTFTPKYGSWLNLVEGFFSKLARSVLRRICVSSKQELKERLTPDMIRTPETMT
jgi:transposase